jgi:hypothetical protein
MNEIAEKCIEYARHDDYPLTASLLWSAAKEINRLEHENAELIFRLQTSLKAKK